VDGKGSVPPAGQARVFCEQCFELMRLMEQNRQAAQLFIIRHNACYAAYLLGGIKLNVGG